MALNKQCADILKEKCFHASFLHLKTEYNENIRLIGLTVVIDVIHSLFASLWVKYFFTPINYSAFRITLLEKP